MRNVCMGKIYSVNYHIKTEYTLKNEKFVTCIPLDSLICSPIFAFLTIRLSLEKWHGKERT